MGLGLLGGRGDGEGDGAGVREAEGIGVGTGDLEGDEGGDDENKEVAGEGAVEGVGPGVLPGGLSDNATSSSWIVCMTLACRASLVCSWASLQAGARATCQLQSLSWAKTVLQ